jgi:catecholate siderophore receptor
VFFDRETRGRHTELEFAGLYVQDQLEITDYFQVIGGLRFDRFDIDFENTLNGATIGRVDNVWSPRLGFVFKPFEALSLYASSSRSFLPGAGDQFNLLTVTSQNLEPEEFNNRELGFKWEVAERLFFTGAIYTLDRENQIVTTGPQTGTQVGQTRTEGGELGLTGYVTEAWQVSAGYGHQVAEVVVGAPGDVGKEVPWVPHHTFSLWNKYQFTQMWGAGVGVVHRTEYFAALDNTVTIPGYTRVDAALFLELNENWSAQLNVENVLDEEYFISAHNNNNISPGAPRSAYLTVKASY